MARLVRKQLPELRLEQRAASISMNISHFLGYLRAKEDGHTQYEPYEGVRRTLRQLVTHSGIGIRVGNVDEVEDDEDEEYPIMSGENNMPLSVKEAHPNLMEI